MSDSAEGPGQSPVAPAPAAELPPPTYAATQPQILVTPLPDSASFFWGRTVQGEVYVKGLGQRSRADRGVQRLSVKLELVDDFPPQPPVQLVSFPESVLYPPSASTPGSTSTPASFASSYRFSIPLPPGLTDGCPLPGTLDLASVEKGSVRYSLTVSLVSTEHQRVEEVVQVEGTPQEVLTPGVNEDDPPVEVEEALERSGVKARLLIDTDRPRLHDLLRCGVEIRPQARQKTGVAGLSSQPNPADTLRPLRRVRVELYRRVELLGQPSSSASTSSTATSPSAEHLTLLHASGKSLRYPGSARAHPPLRVLFTLPTVQLGTNDQSWGEITSSTPYHRVGFFLRVSVGFGSPADVGSSDSAQWILEHPITIRPRLWHEPAEVIIERGQGPDVSFEDDLDEEQAREAYRLKGRDVVGQSGTFRPPDNEDGPPAFDGFEPGPSQPSVQGLPTFLESEEQVRAGDAIVPMAAVPSERLQTLDFEDEDRNTWVGRRGSLGGELGAWIEYDGYETFSEQPPPATLSFGAGGSMDPPQEGEDAANVAGGIAARLGLAEGNADGLNLMERLGLGEGTRVVDLQDDLPPGIDEPSLPALPGQFGAPSQPFGRYRSASAHAPHPVHVQSPSALGGAFDNPPSFDDSEAAQAVGMVAVAAPGPQRQGSQGAPGPMGTGSPQLPPPVVPAPAEGRGAPPGYFGGPTASRTEGGLPPYS